MPQKGIELESLMYICASEVETQAKRMMKASTASMRQRHIQTKVNYKALFFNPLKCIYCHDMVILDLANKL